MEDIIGSENRNVVAKNDLIEIGNLPQDRHQRHYPHPVHRQRRFSVFEDGHARPVEITLSA
jgi:hypothetical protein